MTVKIKILKGYHDEKRRLFSQKIVISTAFTLVFSEKKACTEQAFYLSYLELMTKVK